MAKLGPGALLWKLHHEISFCITSDTPKKRRTKLFCSIVHIPYSQERKEGKKNTNFTGFLSSYTIS